MIPALFSFETSGTFDRLMIAVVIGAVLLLAFIPTVMPWYVALGGILVAAASFLVLREPYLGVLLIAFFLPFERLGAYELGGMTIRISQVMLIITALAWLMRQVFIHRTRLVRNPVLIPVVLFLVVNAISLVNSINLMRSVVVLAFMVFTASLAFVLPMIVRSPSQVRWLMWTMLASFVLVSVFGLFQFGGDMIGLPTTITGLRDLYTRDVLGFTRVQSTAYEPLYFANYLLLPIACALALFLSQRQTLRAAGMLGLFGLGMVLLVLTVSRGAYLAVAAALAVVALYYLKRLLRPQIIATFLVAAFVAGWVVLQALGAGGGVLTLDKFQDHILNVFYGASFDERMYTFELAHQAWQEHPWLGIGVGAFGPWAAPHPAYMPEDGWRIVNNEFIEILAETGIVGLIAFALIVLVLVIRSMRAIRVARDGYLRAVMVGLFAAFLGILVQYQTFSTLYIMHVWFVIGCMIAVQNCIIHTYDRSVRSLE